jgi:hypothetical protein
MNMGSLGIPELLIMSCICLVPLVIVAGVVIALLVVVRGRKPKAESREWIPQASAPEAPRDSVSRPEPALASQPPATTRATAVPELVMKSCPSCGADNPVGNAFCEYCGASLAEK